MTFFSFALDPVSFSLDASVGHIAALCIADDGRQLSPLHRAPWVDDTEAVFEATTPPNVKRLSGDFFCAPFGRNDVVEAPSHGWPANSSWDHVETTRADDHLIAAFILAHTVMGAEVEKRITLRAGHPFIYQEHRFRGGQGAVSAAHHVMVHMQAGGRLAVSPKAFAFTPPGSRLRPTPHAAARSWLIRRKARISGVSARRRRHSRSHMVPAGTEPRGFSDPGQRARRKNATER
jgi:hypothetical protein